MRRFLPIVTQFYLHARYGMSRQVRCGLIMLVAIMLLVINSLYQCWVELKSERVVSSKLQQSLEDLKQKASQHFSEKSETVLSDEYVAQALKGVIDALSLVKRIEVIPKKEVKGSVLIDVSGSISESDWRLTFQRLKNLKQAFFIEKLNLKSVAGELQVQLLLRVAGFAGLSDKSYYGEWPLSFCQLGRQVTTTQSYALLSHHFRGSRSEHGVSAFLELPDGQIVEVVVGGRIGREQATIQSITQDGLLVITKDHQRIHL